MYLETLLYIFFYKKLKVWNTTSRIWKRLQKKFGPNYGHDTATSWIDGTSISFHMQNHTSIYVHFTIYLTSCLNYKITCPQHSEEISDYGLHTWGPQLRQRGFQCAYFHFYFGGNLCLFTRLRDCNKQIDIKAKRHQLRLYEFLGT